MLNKITVGADYLYVPEMRIVRVKQVNPKSECSEVGTPDNTGLIWELFWAFNSDLRPLDTKEKRK